MTPPCAQCHSAAWVLPDFKTGYVRSHLADVQCFQPLSPCETLLSTLLYARALSGAQVDAVNSPPTIANVEAGVGPSAATATASGSFTTTSGASGTVSVTGLTPATNYTVPITLCMSARILKQEAEGLLGNHVLMLLDSTAMLLGDQARWHGRQLVVHDGSTGRCMVCNAAASSLLAFL